MPLSPFAQYVQDDLLAEFDVRARAMFGGYGVYKDGIFFGLIADDELYFKVDETNKVIYQKYGSEPFTYSKGKNKPVTMNYYVVPADIIEDEKTLLQWANTAYEIATIAKKSKPAKKSKYEK